MARIKGGLNAKTRHNRTLKLAKGYRGARSKQYRVAKQSVMRALTSSYAEMCIRDSQWIEEVAEPGAAFLSAVGVFQGGSDIVSGVADQQYKKQNNRILVYLQDYDDFASGSRSGGLQ